MQPRTAARVATFATAIALAIGGSASAQTVVESSSEIRFQLDLVVPQSALDPLLPPGFAMNVATQGNAKDCNLRVIFIDRLTINGPDGNPLATGSNRHVYMAVPVRDPAGNTAQLMIGGLTGDPTDAPGPFGNYIHATTATVNRTINGQGANVTETQDWVFNAATGEHLELHVTFERGVAIRRPAATTTFYSAKDPAIRQLSEQEQVLEVLRNVTTTPPDRVKAYEFKGSGGSYAKIFDGTEKTVSWDNIVWLMRTVSKP